MAPDDLTPSVVVYWLRKQATRYSEMAKKFNEAAQALESTVDPSASSAGMSTAAPMGAAPGAATGAATAGPVIARPRLASPLNKAS